MMGILMTLSAIHWPVASDGDLSAGWKVFGVERRDRLERVQPRRHPNLEVRRTAAFRSARGRTGKVPSQSKCTGTPGTTDW